MTHRVIERLASEDPRERAEACREAAEDASATLLSGALCAALGDPSKAVVRAASDALVAIGTGVGGVEEELRRALHGDSPRQRFAAAFTSARLEPPGPRLLPPLVEAMASRDGDTRWAAVRLLVQTGRLHGEVLPLLTGLVRTDASASVRRMATFALRELAPDAPATAAALVDASRDADVHVRRAATTCMAALLSPPETVARRLVESLAATDPGTRRLAALALGELGAREPEAMPTGLAETLRAAARDGDTDLDRAIERALARLASPDRARQAREADESTNGGVHA